MHMQSPPGSSHQGRLYVVLITLVVGAIFFLLVSNSGFKGVSVTGSSVGLLKSNASTASEEAGEEQLYVESENKEEVTALRSREVQVELTFDEVPLISKKVKVKDMELRFRNPGTKMRINNDLLELNNIEDVALKLQGFSGELTVQQGKLSLDGAAKRIEVNDLAFSSKSGLSLSLSGISYDFLGVDEIELRNLQVPSGNGQLKVAEKLQYVLEQEEVNFYSFVGKMVIDKDAETILIMEGVARGIDVSGALLNLDLR